MGRYRSCIVRKSSCFLRIGPLACWFGFNQGGSSPDRLALQLIDVIAGLALLAVVRPAKLDVLHGEFPFCICIATRYTCTGYFFFGQISTCGGSMVCMYSCTAEILAAATESMCHLQPSALMITTIHSAAITLLNVFISSPFVLSFSKVSGG